MIGKAKHHFNHNQPRLFGNSPLKRNDLPLQQQKQNIPLMNPISGKNVPKPLISPKKNQMSERVMLDHNMTQRSQTLRNHRSPQNTVNTQRLGQTFACCNHPNKKAEFKTFIDDCDEYFCGRCAAQLATQGCKVQTLQNSMGHSLRISKRNELPYLPQYQKNPIYHDIVDILKMCNTVVDQHSANIDKFSSLQEEYSHQADMTTAFYDRLIEIIQEMKSDHLSDLMQEKDKYTQIADIENDNLRENIIEINVIKNDIENHMEEVLEGIEVSGDPGECRDSLDHYRQKLTLFRHQTEEQLEQISRVTRYSQEKIDRMLQSFQDFLKVMWHQGAPVQLEEMNELQENTMPYKQLNSAMTVKNIHQILPRGVSCEGENKRAFRNLEAEEEEEQNMHDRKSPNFKKI